MAYQYRGKQPIAEVVRDEAETIAYIQRLKELDRHFIAASACGTDRGYTRHRKLKTPQCQPCKDAHAAYQRTRRTRPKMRNQCATYPGYKRHERAGEQPCDMCLDAYAQYMRDYRERRAA